MRSFLAAQGAPQQLWRALCPQAAQQHGLRVRLASSATPSAPATSKDPSTIAKQSIAHRFNLDAPADPGGAPGEALAEAPAAAAAEPPQPKHAFRQPAAMRDLPAELRPHFRQPTRTRHAPVSWETIFAAVKAAAKARYNESVDVSFRLNINPRNSAQVRPASTSHAPDPHAPG